MENRSTVGIINTIFRGQVGGISERSKALTKRQNTKKAITFSDENTQGVQSLYNDAIVIALNIANYGYIMF